MRKVKREEINHFLALYQRYCSLRKVSTYTGRSVNTIKKYLNGRIQIHLKNIVTEADLSNDLLIGIYVGIWMGDGTQYYDNSYTIKICSNKQQLKLNKFIQGVIKEIFGKDSCLIEEKNTNRAYIKFHSKFIYNFIFDFVSIDENKTKTVRLKEPIRSYSVGFLKGVLLGLSLSDGYLRKTFKFNVISEQLSNNVILILQKLGYNPKRYIHNRSKYHWNDLHMVSLSRSESRKLSSHFDEILKDMDSNATFSELKKVAPR